MTNWKSNRVEADTSWLSEQHTDNPISWYKRIRKESTEWNKPRDHNKNYSREYVLWSFFVKILTAITDPKDDHALLINTDPYYEIWLNMNPRVEHNTEWSKWR